MTRPGKQLMSDSLWPLVAMATTDRKACSQRISARATGCVGAEQSRHYRAGRRHHQYRSPGYPQTGRLPVLDRTSENAERCSQCLLAHDGEDFRLAPRSVDLRPVVVRRHEGASVVRGFDLVAVEVA